jgi:outer membrane protein assembly factor BamA
VPKKELYNFLYQKPNIRIIWMKLYMRLYLLSNPNKKNWLNEFLRKNGEAPVVFDEFLINKSQQQMKLYLYNKGYYNAEVNAHYRVFKNKKVKIFYEIKPNKPFYINSVNYQFEDSSVMPLFFEDTINSYLRKNSRFDLDTLQAERRRIETYFKNIGFYDFSRDNVVFIADSSNQNFSVNLTLIIRKTIIIDSLGNYITSPLKKYKINNVNVFPFYDQQKALTDYKGYINSLDTISYKGIYFLYKPTDRFNKEILYQSIFLTPNSTYNLNNIQNTYLHLSDLKRYKSINFKFQKNEDNNDTINNTGSIDCNIFLSPTTRQFYAVQLEGTNSSGNLGGGVNLIYQHKNIFGGFEILNLKLRGAYEAVNTYYGIKNTLEIGAESNLLIHKFLLPFKTDKFIKKYNPKTSITFAYNYQKRPIYTRTIANFEYGYSWTISGNQYHLLNPIVINLVNISDRDENFFKKIDSTYLGYSYQNHFIDLLQYSYQFIDRKENNKTINHFFRFNIEFAGNLLTAANMLFNKKDTIGNYKLFGIIYSEFIKTDFDFRYVQIIDAKQSIAYRFFSGIGVPYGNSKTLPFEKKYFGGGANSLRAWQIRTLGPGSYNNANDILNFPNQTADMKLEANIEYRFKLFWIIEGALFTDIGNIWAVNSNDVRNGACFKFNSFYKQVAIGNGLGFRFDFSFFMLRLDLGMKLYNPAKNDNEKWIWNNEKVTNSNNFNITFGIGYPF